MKKTLGCSLLGWKCSSHVRYMWHCRVEKILVFFLNLGRWRGLKWLTEWKSFSHIWLFATQFMDNTVHWILQARILEWVAFPFSRGSSQPRDQAQASRTAGALFTSLGSSKSLKVPSFPPSLSLIHTVDLAREGSRLGGSGKSVECSRMGQKEPKRGTCRMGRRCSGEGSLEPGWESTFSVG